ncbi:MAG: hypothetical protein JG781_1005 [Peptococcaceae bacterium]|jgi:ferredoxin hydrogenase large subunit|nr:hypothetical protein [Peptococcaceae bacterium]
MNNVSEISKIRRRVFTEVARLHWQGKLSEEIDSLPEKLVEQHQQRYRCCEYKEKAIYAERIKLAMGLSLTAENHKKPLGTLTEKALKFANDTKSQIEVIDIACEQCPINKFFVTNACRNCLVHSCLQSCPRGAISIVQNQAYIDQNRCVECGLCKKSCRYGAILEIHRPCEQACGVKAIKSGEDRKAVIDHTKCVDCGTCVISCPFGALSDRSQLLKVITLLKSKSRVIALVAPSIIGQFGQKEDPRSIFAALEQLGFAKTVEVAVGADIIAIAEGEEYLKRVPGEIPFLTSSCCPAFVKVVKDNFKDLEKNISSCVSPMAATASMLKERDPEVKTVFIGPCMAKKREALEAGCIDAVLTYEELAALFVAAGINVSGIETMNEDEVQASAHGQGFASSGGVTQALLASLPEEKRSHVKPLKAEGLLECTQVLGKLAKGEITATFLEGMGCQGGCLGGPGVLVDSRLTKKFLHIRGSKQGMISCLENSRAREIISRHPHYLHRNNDKESGDV